MRWELPEDKPRAFALFAHRFSCSKDIFAVSRISAALASRGIAVLRFDFTGLGHSDGDFANTNFSSNVEDLVAAAGFLTQHYAAPALLIGHSLGGTVALMAAESLPNVRALVTIGAPADPQHVSGNFFDHITEIEERGWAEVTLGGRPFTIKNQFLDDIGSQRVLESVGSLRKALLILHAPRDEYVGINNASTVFSAAKHPKSFVSLNNADHLLTRKSDSLYVGDVISTWVSRYLAEELDEAESPRPPEGYVVVQETGAGKFANVVLSGRHVSRVDEPEGFGGDDTGPSPYDYLAVSLGACTSMTLRMYADRKKWPLERVTVTLKHEKKHAEDSEEYKGNVDHIDRVLRIEGDLDDAQRARLMEIADKCPVHKTLNNPVVIETTLDR